jgi:hypothetical protein
MFEKYFLGEITLDEMVDWTCQIIYNAICEEVAKYGLNS